MARILLLSHYALPHLGGIEVVVDALARELGRAGHEVVHVASDGRRDGETVPEPTAYRVIRVPASNLLERIGVPYPVFGPRLLGVLRREVAAADVVHGHGLLYMGTVGALGAALMQRNGSGGPVRVVTEHVGHVPYDSKALDRVESLALGGLGRASARAAEAVVVLNAKVWGEVAALAPGVRLALIPNGVDAELYRPPAPGERAALRAALGWDARPRVLFVGRLVKKKGIDLACAAAAELGDRARLVVVGPGQLDPALAGHPAIEVLGAQPRERVAELYRAADVFLLPSRGEGFPLTAQEAMASGLPVVLAEDPSYAPYLRGAATGACMAAAQPGALVAALAPLLAPAAREVASAAATRHARAAFSWRAAADAHLALYQDIRESRATTKSIGFVRYDLATQEKLPVVRRLVAGPDGPPLSPCLDIGVGTGFQTFRAFEGALTLALDAWRPNLEEFRAGLGEQARARTAMVQASGDRLPFADDSIGTVLCSEVLEHLEDDRTMVAEIARVLAPGGAVVITVPSLYYGFDAYTRLLGMKTVHDFPGPERHVRPGYTEADLRALLEGVGLELERVEYLFKPVTKLAMESVSVAHMAYQRLAHGRTSWAWNDAAQAEGGLAFKAYRAVFPALRAMAALDSVVRAPGGFGLAVRARKPVGGTA